jgi:Mrp family chromosome partitioning ATPase
LTAWTKELETTATTAATAATADKSSSEAKDKEADVPSGDVQGGSQMPPAAVTVAQNNGLKRRCVGTASSGGGDGATTTTTPETMNRSEEEAMADRSSFWELVGLIDARYGRRTFALLVCAMTAFFAFVFSVIV